MQYDIGTLTSHEIMENTREVHLYRDKLASRLNNTLKYSGSEDSYPPH